MPQEIALYGEFSIRETMMYFGWIFGMHTSEIAERLQFLLNFLDLPSESRLVKNLRFVFLSYLFEIFINKTINLQWWTATKGIVCCRINARPRIINFG